jgi:thioredoxin 1
MLKITKYSADFCRPCKTLQKTMDEILSSYSTNVIYNTVNVEEEIDLVRKLRIMTVPTMIFEHDDKIVYRFSGTKSGNEIKAIIDNYIE